jgi:hypothetical protein
VTREGPATLADSVKVIAAKTVVLLLIGVHGILLNLNNDRCPGKHDGKNGIFQNIAISDRPPSGKTPTPGIPMLKQAKAEYAKLH